MGWEVGPCFLSGAVGCQRWVVGTLDGDMWGTVQMLSAPSPLIALGRQESRPLHGGLTTTNELQHPEHHELLCVLYWQTPFLRPQPPKCTGHNFMVLFSPFVGPIQMFLLKPQGCERKELTETQKSIQSVYMFIDGWNNRSISLSLSLSPSRNFIRKCFKKLYSARWNGSDTEKISIAPAQGWHTNSWRIPY